MFGAFAGMFVTLVGLGGFAQGERPLPETKPAVDQVLVVIEADADGSGDAGDAAVRAERLEIANLRRVLRRQQLALAAGLDPAVSMSSDWRTDQRQRTALREALGYDRWRRLGDARFQLQLRQVQGYNEHRDLRDLPIIYEQVEDSLRSNFGKLARDYLEERLGIDEMLDRKRDRLRNRWRAEDGDGDSEVREERSSGLRISPRLSLGSSSYLGAKFQLRSSPLLRRFGLRVSHAFDSDEMSLKLTYDKGPQRFLLEHRFEDPDRGDTTAFSMRMAF
jgi:hypothetical protein